MAVNNYYITTVDNPYDPKTNFQEWLNYDIVKGYGTCERLASIADTSDKNTDQENIDIEYNAMNEMVKLGAIGKDGKLVEYKILEYPLEDE